MICVVGYMRWSRWWEPGMVRSSTGGDFGLGCVNPSADHRLSLCGGVYAIICMLAHRVGEIEWGAGFCLQNMKPSLANLVLTRGVQI